MGAYATGKISSLIGLPCPFIDVGMTLQFFKRNIGAQFSLLMEVGGSEST